jgi:DNA-binding NarL/FixJ family response regulator
LAKITVYIADPIAIFREGIYVALAGEEDIEVVGATSIFKEAERFIKAHSPNVAILHINGGKPSGLEITRRLKLESRPVQVILMLDNEDDERLFSAIKSGVSACITRGIDPDHLVSTIKEVAKGAKPISQALLHPSIASRILD